MHACGAADIIDEIYAYEDLCRRLDDGLAPYVKFFNFAPPELIESLN
jgi:hypothetical protein